MMTPLESPAGSSAPVPEAYADWLADVQQENDVLRGENDQLQALVDEAKQLSEKAVVLRSRPPSAQSRREEEVLMVETQKIKERASQCTSRPTSAGSSRPRIMSRPTSATGWKKPTSRPLSATPIGPGAESGAWRPVALQSPTSSVGMSRGFPVELDRSGGASLGMKIRPVGSVLEITKVKDDGLVAEWNAANPSRTLRKGDRITVVNGRRGDADELFKECMQEAPLSLTVESADGAESVLTPCATPLFSTPPWCRQQIKALMEKHDPAALETLDRIMDRFKGREVALYRTMCKRYGEEPASTAEEAAATAARREE